MDYISTKALYIAIGIIVTLAITSAVFLSFNQIKDIYKQVYESDVSIKNEFSKFAMYDNTEMLGIDMINTAKKYLDNPRIIVYCNVFSAQINNANFISRVDYSNRNYSSRKYAVTHTTGNDGIITINFTGR